MELILGTAQLTSAYGVIPRDPNDEDALALLAAAARLGVAALDTAAAYGDAEAVIGRSGSALPVHTKIEPGTAPSLSLSRSLQRLQRRAVDVLYLHDAGEVLRTDGDVLAEAASLVGAGAQSLGASIYDPDQFDAAAGDARIGVVQVPLNVFDRCFSGHRLTTLGRDDVRVVARSVLLQGVLVADPATLPERVAHLRDPAAVFQRLCADLGRSPLEVSIGWVRAQRGLSAMVLGATTVAELEQLVSAFRAPALSPDEMDALDGLALPSRTDCDPRTWASALPKAVR